MNKLDLPNASITKPKSINYEIIGGRKNVIRKEKEIYKTPSRAQIGYQTSILPSLDDLPMIDRSLIDYTKYHKYVGHTGRKNSMAMQATRGCPYKCFYCDIYKTTINHFNLFHYVIHRSAIMINCSFINVTIKTFIRATSCCLHRH